MQIVINIDSYVLEHCKRHVREHYANNIEEAIANGTPLPKGHGNIYDENDIEKGIENSYQCRTVLDGLKLVKPVIKADKESKG